MPRRPSRLRDLISLAKPRVTVVVVATALGGVALAPGEVALAPTLVFLLATFALVGSANALNCWMERDTDALMERTRERPLPAGRLSPRLALATGLGLALAALPTLALLDATTALLGALALVSYVWAYTPMKRRTSAALYVGALPGAVAPLMGWTLVTGRVDAPGVVLGAILFVWQLPHFLIIALRKKDEYARAGLVVFPVAHGDVATRWLAFATTVLLAPLGVSLWWLGATGPGFAIVASLAGVHLAARAAACVRASTAAPRMRRFYRATLSYMLILVAALVADAALA